MANIDLTAYRKDELGDCNWMDPCAEFYLASEVDRLIDVKDRTIRYYEDSYLPRPKSMSVKCWMIGSPETGEQWVYDAEEVDRVIAAKDKEIADLKKKLAEYVDCVANARAKRVSLASPKNV